MKNRVSLLLKKEKHSLFSKIDLFVVIGACIVFFALFLLNYCFPKTCDDITFSAIPQNSVLSILQSALKQGNGRLFGNFFCYLISNTAFTVFEKTFIWFSIIYLCIKLVGSRNIILNTVIAIVLIYPCDAIFAQVYAWNSGFQNYVFPAFIILLDILLFRCITEQKNSLKKALLTCILILSAFFGQFFSENSSLFAVCIAIVLFVLCFINKKNAKLSAFLYVFFAVLGFAVMMIYPHILGTSEKIESYRKYAASFDTFIELVSKNFRLIAKDFTTYFLLWVIVSVAFLLLIKKVIEKNCKNRFVKVTLILSEIILVIYPVFSFFYSVISKFSLLFLRNYFSIATRAALLTYAAVLLYICILYMIEKSVTVNEKIPVVFFVLAGVSIAPLLVVSPIGARTFYLIYVFMFLSSMSIIKRYFEDIRITAQMKAVCVSVLCCLTGILVMAEFDNRYCNNIRTTYFNSELEVGKDKIVLPLLPHQNLIHDDTNANTWKNLIRGKTDKEIELTFVDWNQWYADYYK